MSFDLSVLRAWRESVSGVMESDETLKAIAFEIQRKACTKFGRAYRCIQEGRFVAPRMASHPDYQQVLLELRSAGSLLIDVGCCMGTDLRKLVLDGAAPGSLVGIDLDERFLQLGYDLYHDRGHASAPTFFACDFLSLAPSLTPPGSFLGKASHVFAGSVLHLLSESDVDSFVTRAHAALRRRGVFFGRTLGNHTPCLKEWPGLRRRDVGCRCECGSCLFAWAGPGCRCLRGSEVEPRLRFLHSPQSLTELLERKGFVRVRVSFVPSDSDAFDGVEGPRPQMMAFWAEKEP